MKTLLLKTLFVVAIISSVQSSSKGSETVFYPELQKQIEQAIQEFSEISEERKSELAQIAEYVKENLDSGKPIQLTFICTHNSRRSHLSQIWAQTAAAYYGIPNVYTYSGGTEATAFNPRAVAAVKRAGFNVDQTTQAENPIYHVSFNDDAMPMTGFSKVYNYAPNPTNNFCAVMTCSSADEACPIVQGAVKRIAIPYIDPKVSDNTPLEAATYDERSQQICREMFYAFSLVK